MFCVSCSRMISFSLGSRKKFCTSCDEAIRRYRIFEGGYIRSGGVDGANSHEVLILYEYHGLVRKLILNAKVRCEYNALKAILDLGHEREETDGLSEWARIIMEVPSSFWGRYHGKYDIAGVFARQLAFRAGKKYVQGPSKLYWRTRKRAMDRDKESSPAGKAFPFQKMMSESFKKKLEILGASKKYSSRRILVVDDIVTSGFTMSLMAGELEGWDVKFLAFAGPDVSKTTSSKWLSKHEPKREHDNIGSAVFREVDPDDETIF
ncbi:MAG: hypothetical protein HQK54_00685 [Oligoflexales bacterium]|nr:hypothetical protein [Oligoflexales bacterium]